MLRKSLPISPFVRQFSISRTTWNLQNSKTDNKSVADDLGVSSVTPNLDVSSKVSTTPSSSESTSFEKLDSIDARTQSTHQLYFLKQRLRFWTERAAIILRVKADDFTASTKSTFSQLGSELNRVTGYDEIEVLKRGIVEQEERINATREAAKKAKQAFEAAVAQRATSQREVNDLLSRKSMWGDSDVGRFTTLVRQDHLYEQEETQTKAAVEEKEAAVEREFSQLLRAILARYHEEQVWSDKIRSASTYGSLAALALNMLVFIMAIVVVEPWKRRRLAQTFERKLEELSSENEARLQDSMQSISQQIAQQVTLLDGLKKEVAVTEIQVMPAPNSTPVSVPVPQNHQPSSKFKILQWHLSQQQLEVTAMALGAFAFGVLSTAVLGR